MANETTPLLSHTEDGEVVLPPSNVSYSGDTEVAQGDVETVNGAGEQIPKCVDDVKDVDTKAILLVFLPMAVGVFLVAMDTTIVTSTYATIGNEFEQLQSTSWIMTGYMITMTSFQPLYGKLSDVFGRKTCMICAYSIFAIGSLLCGFAGNMGQLIAARALAGVGGGAITTINAIVLTDVVPRRQRGTWQGLTSVTFYTGQGCGAPLGGFLTDLFGWRWAFIVQAPLTCLAIIAVYVGLKLPEHDMSSLKSKLKRIDFTGAAVLIVSVFSLLVALDRGGNVSWSDRVTIVSMVASAVSFLLFYLVETFWAVEPIIPKGVIVDRSMLIIYATNFISMGGAYCMPYNASLYLQAIQKFNPTHVGFVLLSCAFGGSTGSLLAGYGIQLTGRYYWITLVEYGICLMGVTLVAGTTGLWPYVTAILCFGLGSGSFGGVGGANANFVGLITFAGPELQAVATSVLWTSRSLGGVVLLSLNTAIIQATLRNRLYERLTGANVDEIVKHVRESLGYLRELEPTVREVVVRSYQDGLQMAMWTQVVLMALAMVTTAFMKEKPIPR
ncbi:MFS general substrate transporter [Amylocystis lapponica]|nr:MFS general substrate transporter [Amylocystis lapponica]